MTSKIALRDVTKMFRLGRTDGKGAVERDFVAIHDFTYDIEAGDFLVIVGPGGCGKSTVLDLLAGLQKPTSGDILMDGCPIEGPDLRRAVVFQQYALLPWRSATQNVEFSLEAKGMTKAERREIAAHYLALIGLAGFEHHLPHQLSGGMKQRAAIARSLVHEPDVLLGANARRLRGSLEHDGLRIDIGRQIRTKRCVLSRDIEGVGERIPAAPSSQALPNGKD